MPSLSEVVRDQKLLVRRIYCDNLPEEQKRKFASFFEVAESEAENLEKIKLWKSLSIEDKKLLGEHFCRLQDLENRTENCINSIFSADFAKNSPEDASSLTFTVKQKLEGAVSREQMSDIIKRLSISVSVTAHPTNLYSTEYSMESMQFDEILAQENSAEKEAALTEQIKKMMSLDPIPRVKHGTDEGKKTQALEVEEALSCYMENIYYEVTKAADEVRRVLMQSDQYRDLVSVFDETPFFHLNAWLSGDGDGNPSADETALANNLKLFQERILSLYKKDLEAIELICADASAQDAINILKQRLGVDLELNPENFITELAALNLPEEAKKSRDDLVYRVKTFGFHYAKIDVRHNADDISETVADILVALGKLGEGHQYNREAFIKSLQGDDSQEVANFIGANLKEIQENPDLLKAIDVGNFSKDSKRVFDRLKIVAESPECFSKLIIAECKHQGNALSALFLLAAAGAPIKDQKSIDVVTLSESAKDLRNIKTTIDALLSDDDYVEHIAARGMLSFMIAKSDTQRADGVGAQVAQEEAIELAILSFAENRKRDPRLKDVMFLPFNGGGHALQRGGGRIDEIPNVYAKAAMRLLFKYVEEGMNVEDAIVEVSDCLSHVLPPTLTTQGHQNFMLFSKTNAASFLLSYYSQSLLAAAKMVGLVEDSEITKGGQVNELAIEARKDRILYSNAAMEFYGKHVAGKNAPINHLFTNGPHFGVDSTNFGSRPSKRKLGVFHLLNQRAIGSDRTCTHSCTHLINWYSAKQGLEEVISQKGFDKMCSMYDEDKATRDSFRSMATSLSMTNFANSWRMMIEEERPSSLDDIKILAAKYDDLIDGKISISRQL